VNKSLRLQTARFAGAALIVAAITLLYLRVIHVNPTTVGFSFLLSVLIVSTLWGLACSVFTAVLATLVYNFFFLPPVGTFTIADPQNWVALVGFLITAVIASHLSNRARQEALKADQRRQDVERLYAFSQQLLATDNILELLNGIPGQIVQAFNVTSAAILLTESGKTYYSDLDAPSRIEVEALRITASRNEPRTDEAKAINLAPLRIGIRSVGALGVINGTLSPETLDAVGSLIAIAVERAGAIEQLSRTEAARENEKLRSVLLDSVTHEFRTPLTSLLAAAKSLRWDEQLDESARQELLEIINEDGERLNRLVGEAAEMAQLDARQVELDIEPHDMRVAIEGALEQSSHVAKAHPIELDIPDSLPKVQMDIKRIQEVIAHLLDNAGKYAPAGTPIHVSAELRGGNIVTSVADQGSGIDEFEQGLIFDKFYRGRGQRSAVHGTGMGLAIVKAIVEAHGGAVGLTSQLGHGSVFYFSIPMIPNKGSQKGR
jgi:two-component system sensor histidine kinase KdpD